MDDATLVGQERSGTKVAMGARSTTVGHVALVIVGLTGLLCHDFLCQRRVLESNITINSLGRVNCRGLRLMLRHHGVLQVRLLLVEVGLRILVQEGGMTQVAVVTLVTLVATRNTRILR